MHKIEFDNVLLIEYLDINHLIYRFDYSMLLIHHALNTPLNCSGILSGIKRTSGSETSAYGVSTSRLSSKIV